MNFTQPNIDKILAGEKTMTRRIIKDGEWLAERGVIKGTGTKWRIGQDYAICPGRGKKAVGRIRITDIRRERLQDITEDDAKREGAHAIEWTESHPVQIGENEWDDGLMTMGSYRYGFEELWDSIYHDQPAKQWDKNPTVWVLSFELVD